MKKLLIGLLAFTSVTAFAADQSDKLSKIKDVIDGHEQGIDNYHYGRLKGYLEGLNLEKGFKLSTGLSESAYRINLVALKDVIKSIKNKYPEINLKTTVKSMAVTGTRNNFGGCVLYGKNLAPGYEHKTQQLEFGFRGDLLGEKFNKYTKPVIQSCSRQLLEAVEKNLTY